MTDLKISRTTAIWLIRVCTKVVRDGMNSPWNPISSALHRTYQGAYLTTVTRDLEPNHVSWVEAMFSICKIIASSLAFQMEPQLCEEMLENPSITSEPSAVESLLSMKGSGTDYFGMGEILKDFDKEEF
jgi:hypothetical protein